VSPKIAERPLSIHPARDVARQRPRCASRWRGAVPAAAVLALAACGGGGGAVQTTATPQTVDNGPAAGGTRATILAAAPSLPAGSPPVPSLPYRCGNVAIGAASSGEIEVPAGEVCVLQRTYVDGNIKLGRGSVLDARDVTVIGNLQADGAASVLLAGVSSLTGSVQVKQGQVATVVGARIGGDLQFEANSGALRAESNQVGGNIQVVGNRGGVTLLVNRAIGNLQCKENQPAPAGGGNTAASIEDQCLNLQPAPTLPPDTPVNPPVAPTPPATGPGLPAASFPSGSNVVCRDVSLGSQTYANVTVPAGARCELASTRLTGNLALEPGAGVEARDARINGNLQADGAARVRVVGGNIDGSVQIERGGPVTLDAGAVGGSVQLKANPGLLWLQALRVTGDIQLFDNRGGATLQDNSAGGNLQCKDNAPAPTGGGNRATSKEDQCSAH
jgi:hypothetical protein